MLLQSNTLKLNMLRIFFFELSVFVVVVVVVVCVFVLVLYLYDLFLFFYKHFTTLNPYVCMHTLPPWNKTNNEERL